MKSQFLLPVFILLNMYLLGLSKCSQVKKVKTSDEKFEWMRMCLR